MNTTNTIMSRKRFLAKNKNKFDALNLNAKQRDQRYANYLKSSGKVRVRVKSAPPKQRAPQIKITKSTFSDCSLLYGQVLTNPFDNVVGSPCIPDLVCVPSFKYNTTINTTMTTNGAGFGVVAFDPWTMAASGMGLAPSGIDFPLATSTASYPHTGSVIINPAVMAAGEMVGTNANTLIDIAIVTKGEIRLVAAGIEICYIGAVLNQAGTVTCLQTDGLRPPPPAGVTLNEIQGNPRARVVAVSKDKKAYQTYYPTDAALLGYQNIQTFMASNQNTGNYHPLLLVINGCTPGSIFQVRARAFFEAQLPGMSVSPSESDPVGMAKVLESRSRIRETEPAEDTKSVLFSALRTVGEGVSRAAPYLGAAIGGFVGQPEVGAVFGQSTQKVLDALLKN